VCHWACWFWCCSNRRIQLCSCLFTPSFVLYSLLLPSGLQSPEVSQDMCMQGSCLRLSHSNLWEIVECNFKASRVCDPTIVDVCLISMGNIESDPGRGHLGQRPDLRRRGWRMCWFGREDQTCSTRNRIADTHFDSSFFVLYSSLKGYWLDRVHLSQIFLISCYMAAR